MKLLKKLYKCDVHISENKYLQFMWESITYETISKEEVDGYTYITHTHNVEANFIDHLFNKHYVKMRVDAIVYRSEQDRNTSCTVVLFTTKKEDSSSDEDDRNDEEKGEEKIKFVASSWNRKVVGAKNETMLEALCDRIGIQQDDPDKPTPVQFESFLCQFCFIKDKINPFLEC
jgi:hypothetical protein